VSLAIDQADRRTIPFTRVTEPWWDDKPVVLVGGGPSLKGVNLRKLRGRAHVVAVKGCMFDLPWADCGFILDLPRIREWQGRMHDLEMPIYLVVPDELPYQTPDIPTGIWMRRDPNNNTFSSDPFRIATGGSSGFGAMNLAYLKRARRIILLGYDYTFSAKADMHHNECHYVNKRRQRKRYWQNWARNFEAARRYCDKSNIEVINGSPESVIDVFPKCTPEEAMQHLGGV
jgi:hypothetical protein